MTEEQIKELYDFALQSTVKGKEEKMLALLDEAKERQLAGAFDKKFATDVGMRMLACVRLECMGPFIAKATKLKKEYSID